METNQLICSDNFQLFYRVWIPENKNVHSVVHIFHGMAEHSARYDRFARYLNNLGIAVYAQDHRGHGHTSSDDDLGWFAPKKGWQRVMQDGYELSQLIAQNHPHSDLFLFGHSMGSFLVRALIARHPARYTGAVICGTGAGQGIVGITGKGLARLRSLRKHGKRPDALLDSLSFGAFNKAFEPAKTSFDWLSRDDAEVQAYIDDQLCGFVCTSRFFVDLLAGISMANSRRLMQRIPRDFPLLIISGSNDPVGNFSKGVQQVYQTYRDVGIEDVTLQLIHGARHELLNETNRDEIHTIIGTWLESHKSRKSR
jgi:alpha-beta hydrolase superfamily lysophospholipase